MHMPIYMTILLTVFLFVTVGSEKVKHYKNMYKDSNSYSRESNDNLNDKLSNDESKSNKDKSYSSDETDDYKEINIDDKARYNYYIARNKRKSYGNDNLHHENNGDALKVTLLNTILNDKFNRTPYNTTPIGDVRDEDPQKNEKVNDDKGSRGYYDEELETGNNYYVKNVKSNSYGNKETNHDNNRDILKVTLMNTFVKSNIGRILYTTTRTLNSRNGYIQNYKEDIDDKERKKYSAEELIPGNNYYVKDARSKSYEDDETHNDNNEDNLKVTIMNALLNGKFGRMLNTTTSAVKRKEVHAQKSKKDSDDKVRKKYSAEELKPGNNYYVKDAKSISYEDDETHHDNKEDIIKVTLMNTMLNSKLGRMLYTTAPTVDSRNVDPPKKKKVIVYTKEWYPGYSLNTKDPKYIKTRTTKSADTFEGDVSVWEYKTKMSYSSNEDDMPRIKSKQPYLTVGQEDSLSTYTLNFVDYAKSIKSKNPYLAEKPSDYPLPFKTDIKTKTYTRTTYIYPDYYDSEIDVKRPRQNIELVKNLANNPMSTLYNKPRPTPSSKSNQPYPTSQDVTTKTGWPSIKSNQPHPTSRFDTTNTYPSIKSNQPYPTSQNITSKTGLTSIKTNKPYPTTRYVPTKVWPSVKSKKPHPTSRHVTTKTVWPSIKSNKPYPTNRDVTTKSDWASANPNQPHPTSRYIPTNIWPSVKSNQPHPTSQQVTTKTDWPSVISNQPYPTAKNKYPHPTKTKGNTNRCTKMEPINFYY